MDFYSTLYNTQNWKICEKRFFDDLDFIDFFENYASLERKKSKLYDSLKKDDYCIGYFFNDKLLRIEEIRRNSIPSDTFLLWENDLLVQVHSFYMGYFYGKKVSETFDPHNSWYYIYDGKRLSQVRWICHPNLKYFNTLDLESIYTYKYDECGLQFIYKTVKGDHSLESFETVEVFNREKEKLKKKSSLTKVPLTGRNAPKSDGLAIFNCSTTNKTSTCSYCSNPMTYILTVNLNDKRLNSNKINSKSIPVLFCFECLESNQYEPSKIKIGIGQIKPFTDKNFIFKREINEEKAKDSFIKIGGQPNWIHDEESPICDKCNSVMKLVMEINSDDQLSNGRDFLTFGDNGKLYVFACCDLVRCIPQYY